RPEAAMKGRTEVDLAGVPPSMDLQVVGVHVFAGDEPVYRAVRRVDLLLGRRHHLAELDALPCRLVQFQTHAVTSARRRENTSAMAASDACAAERQFASASTRLVCSVAMGAPLVTYSEIP